MALENLHYQKDRKMLLMKKFIFFIVFCMCILFYPNTTTAMKYTYLKTGQLGLIGISEGKYMDFQYDNNGNMIGRKSLTCKSSEFKLINVNSNKALDVFAGNTSNGTKIQIEEDNGTDAQRWLICNAPNETYKLINVNSGKALDITGGKTAEGTSVQLWNDNGTEAQAWRMVDNGDSSYTLLNVYSNKVLDVADGSVSNGSAVRIWTSNGTSAQKWRLVKAISNGAEFKVLNYGNQKALDVTGGNTADGTRYKFGQIIVLPLNDGRCSIRETTSIN